MEGAEELVGRPVRVVWADWRKGRHLRGYLVLSAISPDSERFYFRGRSMAFQIERRWILTVEPCVN